VTEPRSDARHAAMSEALAHDVGSVGRLGHAYFRRRYTVLFYSLLLTIVAAPALGALRLRGGVLESFLAVNLLVAVIPVGRARDRTALLAAITILGAARLITAWLDHPALSALALGMWAIIGLLAAAGALRFALRARVVGAEQLYAALSAYLLAGIFSGLFYFVLEQISPSSFAVTGELSRFGAIYFSFVTLATLGYGDVVPRSDLARSLAIVEGIGGQLFLAVLVARLVSLYVRNKDASG